MARYEKKKTEGINLAEMLGILGVDEADEMEVDDEDIKEKMERVRALNFVRFILNEINPDTTGCLIEYSNGRLCTQKAGGEVVHIQGDGPDTMFGIMNIISSVMMQFGEEKRDEILMDLFNGTKVFMQFKQDRGME